MTTTYHIAPATNADLDLAGEGNTFASFDDAYAAACDMDRTNPLPCGDEWIVYVREDGRPARRV